MVKEFMSENNQNNRIEWITYAQLLAMILITFSHSFSGKIVNPSWSGLAIQISQSIGLTVFMFVSGYLMEETHQIEKYGYFRFVARRAKRLLIPFFCMQIIMLLPKYLLDANKDAYTFSNIFHGFLFPREGILPHLWFLLVLFIICLLLPLLRLLLKKTWSLKRSFLLDVI